MQLEHLIYEALDKELINEDGYSEAWELLLMKEPEIKQFLKQNFGVENVDTKDPKMDQLAKEIGVRLDNIETKFSLPWTAISRLKAIDWKWIDLIRQTIHKSINSGDTERIKEQYVKLMDQRDAEGDKRPGGRIPGGTATLFDNVEKGIGDPPVLLHIDQNLYAIGGRTRLYAAYAQKKNINVIIINQRNVKQLTEGFDPYNLKNPNPLESIDPSKICYFDTETTGVGPTNQIVEIAAVLGDKEFYEKIFLTEETKKRLEYEKDKVSKGRRDKTVKELLDMSNYYDEKVKPTSTELDALNRFKEFVTQADFLLAHNATFDMEMVNGRLKWYRQQPIKGIKVLDSLAFSRRFFIPALITLEQTNKNPQTRQRAKEILDKMTKSFYESGQRKSVQSNLGSLTNALIGQIENWHQAMADVKSTKNLVENFFKLLMDKHIKSDYGEDIRSKKTFQDYYMRNKRFEQRFKK